MKKPDLLPDHLSFITKTDNEQELFDLLKCQTLTFVEFFENATEDEMWCLSHQKFFQLSLAWFSDIFFKSRLAHHFATRVLISLQKHYSAFDELIPKNLFIFIEGRSFSVNHFMVAASSDKLFNQIVSSQERIYLKNINVDHFHLFKEFIETGKTLTLWRYDEKSLLAIHDEAAKLGLVQFMDFCSDILRRYFTLNNVFNYLLLAQKQLWWSLKNRCIEFINSNQIGVFFEKSDNQNLTLEFSVLDLKTFEIFQKMQLLITHLVCGKVAQSPLIGKVLSECPHLLHLDISLSKNFDIEQLPSAITELNLSMCSWLKEEIFHKILLDHKELRFLSISGNIQLSYLAWNSLNFLKNLEILKLSSCYQIDNQTLILIGEAASRLKSLDLNSCSAITNEGFFGFASYCSCLNSLNVGRTRITDGSLLEIVTNSTGITSLLLPGCKEVTEQGIREVIRLRPHLQLLDITRCAISSDFVRTLKETRPGLTVYT